MRQNTILDKPLTLSHYITKQFNWTILKRQPLVYINYSQNVTSKKAPSGLYRKPCTSCLQCSILTRTSEKWLATVFKTFCRKMTRKKRKAVEAVVRKPNKASHQSVRLRRNTKVQQRHNQCRRNAKPLIGQVWFVWERKLILQNWSRCSLCCHQIMVGMKAVKSRAHKLAWMCLHWNKVEFALFAAYWKDSSWKEV